IYTNTYWDEGASELTVFDANGDFERKMEDTHGVNGVLGGHAIAVGGSTTHQAVYAGMNYYNGAAGVPVVRRYAFDGSPDPNFNPSRIAPSPLTIPDPNTSSTDQVRGLAISSTDELFVSDAGNQKIWVYNGITGAAVRNFGVARPRAVAIDPASGDLWIA